MARSGHSFSRRLARRSTFASASLLMASALLVLPSEAHAYIDPSSGGLLLQLILGGTAGVAMLGKLYYRKVIGFFRRSPTPPEAPSDETRLER